MGENLLQEVFLTSFVYFVLLLLFHIFVFFSAALGFGYHDMTRAIFALPKWQSRAQEPGISVKFVSEAADGGPLCAQWVLYVRMYRYLGGAFDMEDARDCLMGISRRR